MPDKEEQTYRTHARVDPLFHYFAAPIALLTVFFALYNLYRRFTLVDCWLVLLSLAFFAAVFLARAYALKVQDRVIRLEETLRMERVLREPLRSRIGELTIPQFIGLRFAPDSELPALVEQTLANRWKAKDIKLAVRDWRPDHYRV